jgi:hypothetical protein
VAGVNRAKVMLAVLAVVAVLASAETTRVTAQQSSWSGWRPAGELVGVRYFERRRDVEFPQRGTHVQWRVENTNTHGVAASVTRKRYTTEDRKVDASYADEGRSLKAGETYTFPQERSPTRGLVIRVECSPVVARE